MLDAGEVAVIERLADRVAAGAFDTGEPPARLHGDLWSGNVLWTAQEAVLIDPAAHGGHRETDLAMLALFGAPHLERVLAAYDEAAPLADGWHDRVLLHQVHPLLLHAVLFGGSYAGAGGARGAALRLSERAPGSGRPRAGATRPHARESLRRTMIATATAGEARAAPSMPATAAPMIVAPSTTMGCRLSAVPARRTSTMVCTMFCTTRMTRRMTMAVSRPLAPSAISVAKAPDTIAPR